MSFYDDVIMKDPRFKLKDRCADPMLLEPVTREKMQLVLSALGNSWVLYETFRSIARQVQLFKTGASKKATIGVHHYGLAFDIVRAGPLSKAWEGDFTLVGEAAKAVGLVWGGDWRSLHDGPHCQRIRIADQGKLFAGTWYPSADYDITRKDLF